MCQKSTYNLSQNITIHRQSHPKCAKYLLTICHKTLGDCMGWQGDVLFLESFVQIRRVRSRCSHCTNLSLCFPVSLFLLIFCFSVPLLRIDTQPSCVFAICEWCSAIWGPLLAVDDVLVLPSLISWVVSKYWSLLCACRRAFCVPPKSEPFMLPHAYCAVNCEASRAVSFAMETKIRTWFCWLWFLGRWFCMVAFSD